MLAEAGVRALSNRTVKRRLPGVCPAGVPGPAVGVCASRAALGPSALVSMTSRPCGSRVRHEAHGSYSPRSGGQREGGWWV